MLGYRIRVLRVSCSEATADKTSPTALLATWETGLNGRDWIEKLVAEGKATKTHDGGYPCRYVSRLCDVLPLIYEGKIIPDKRAPWVLGGDEGEEYLQPPGWMGKVNIFPEELEDCRPLETIVIDAWDQS